MTISLVGQKLLRNGSHSHEWWALAVSFLAAVLWFVLVLKKLFGKSQQLLFWDSGMFLCAPLSLEVMLFKLCDSPLQKVPWWALNQSLGSKSACFLCLIAALAVSDDSSPNVAIRCKTRTYLKLTIVVMSMTNGELCVNALSADKLFCCHFWLLTWWYMNMPVPMSQSEVETELLC